MRSHKQASVGKVVAGVLVGSVVGAAVGWWTAPASLEGMRLRLRGDRMGAEEKAKAAERNLERNFRDLEDVSSDPRSEARMRAGIQDYDT